MLYRFFIPPEHLYQHGPPSCLTLTLCLLLSTSAAKNTSSGFFLLFLYFSQVPAFLIGFRLYRFIILDRHLYLCLALPRFPSPSFWLELFILLLTLSIFHPEHLCPVCPVPAFHFLSLVVCALRASLPVIDLLLTLSSALHFLPLCTFPNSSQCYLLTSDFINLSSPTPLPLPGLPLSLSGCLYVPSFSSCYLFASSFTKLSSPNTYICLVPSPASSSPSFWLSQNLLFLTCLPFGLPVFHPPSRFTWSVFSPLTSPFFLNLSFYH